jgi:phosphoadenosine phosphosulfate reductase
MKNPALKLCIPRPGQVWRAHQLAAVTPCLERMTAQDRIEWALDFLPENHLLTSSFGAQSAVMLHLVSRQSPGIPVLLIDTGYLFPETYRFIDQLVDRLDLNLKVVRPEHSAAWQEARHGQLWKSGAEGIRRYNRINKVEPMERALAEMSAGTWFSGLRRSQSDSRRETAVLQSHGPSVKVHPIADWTNRDVHRYLKAHDLPYHPLWDDGYVSIGDRHTSHPLGAGMTEQDTRFFGIFRECGLHEPDNFVAAGN